METYPLHSKPKHEDTMLALTRMISDLRSTLEAKEPIGTVQREGAKATIASARRDLEQCTSKVDDMLKSLYEPRVQNHEVLVRWLTQLSVDLKLTSLGERGSQLKNMMRPITLERLESGEQLIFDLEDCREALRFVR